MVLVLLVNGPNLNLLGERERELYGSTTLKQIEAMVRARAQARGAALECFQSNCEGALIDFLHARRKHAHGLVFNPGAYTHTSYALRDALVATGLQTLEVHLTDLNKRAESWRQISVIRDVVAGCVMGYGAEGYAIALDQLLDRLGCPRA